MDAASPELVRAWQYYFKQRGGAGPTLPPEVVPVVVLDNNADGPYPCNRPWFAGLRVAGVAAQRSAVGIGNFDGGQPGGGVQGSKQIRSVVVIDRVRIWSVDAAAAVPVDLIVRLTDVNNEPFNGGFEKPVDDAAGDFAGITGLGFTPRIGQVQIGVRNAAVLFSSNHVIPVQGLDVQTIEGPFILSPQQICYFIQEVNTGQLEAFFQGRYYAGA